LDYASTVKKNHNDFTFENDSIKIVYRLNGENTPFRLSIENKTDVPLFIDWAKSGIVYNKTTHPFFSNTSMVSLTHRTNPNNFDLNVFAVTEGVVQHETSVAMLLPKSIMTSRAFFDLRSRRIDLSETPAEREEEVFKEGKNRPTTLYVFNEVNSPMQFQCFLAVTFGIGETANLQSFYHSFF
jgi:hypothetical protein